MAKKKIEKYYITRGETGQEQIYSTPALLLTKAYEYFEWCLQFPHTKKELLKSGERKGDIVDIPINRPFTEEGLCVYCGINLQRLKDYESRVDFADAVAHIRNIIRQEQLEGAALGFYNTSIISRLQGLSDKQDTTHQNTSITIHVSDAKTKQEINKMENKVK